MSEVVAVVGLGYVGLPVALAFGRKFKTIGFDIHSKKIEELKNGHDRNGETTSDQIKSSSMIEFTSDPNTLKNASFIVVSVPTPVDAAKKPDLALLEKACQMVGQNLKKGATVVFESTVYPGVTEKICGPILEKASGLKRSEFKLGYSPERINPGDKVHTLEKITKVVSGEDEATLETVARVYGAIIPAGVYRAKSIMVAEAAKVIENTQRDLNIALMNELALIFDKLGIETNDVIQTASTKWNFLPFKPGLVGGHCIGVDPYYLTALAESLGHHPQVILSGRRINDGMGKFIAQKAVKELIAAGRPVKGANILVLGLTFKENCRDIRNTRVTDIIEELKSFEAIPHVHDPLASPDDAHEEYGLKLTDWRKQGPYSAVIAAVAHDEFKLFDLAALSKMCGTGAPFLDIKSQFERKNLESLGFRVWSL